LNKFAGETIGLTPEKAEIIARELEVPLRDVIEMDRRLSGDVSLNVQVADDGKTEWEAILVDQSPDAEAIVAEHDENARRANALRAALGVLNERERRIFEARHLSEDPPTLDQLGHELFISSERVCQIETLAFAKVERAAIAHLRQRRPAASAERRGTRQLAVEDARS
jgi:RNA polymerase sigma-32 factor